MNIASTSRTLLSGSVLLLALIAPASAQDAAAKAPAQPTDAPVTVPLAPRQETTQYVVDAMVGQVNGRAIYASEVFRTIGEDTLRRVGEVEPRLVFKARATELIDSKLRERVTNALILAEAERGLNERENLGLLSYVKQHREKILAEWGGGVLALAEEKLQREKSHGVEEELEQFRQLVLVDKFKREKLFPKVSVNRREVERYYADHFAEFNPSPKVTLRVIRVPDAGMADEVDKALASGKTFEEVANAFNDGPKRGGIMGPFPLTKPFDQFAELKWTALNEKARLLKEGQHSDRTKTDGGFGWVMLEKLEGGKGRTLQEAFLDIENRMRGQKFNKLFQRYLSDLLKGGNFTPVDQMGRALVEVAMVRYARPL